MIRLERLDKQVGLDGMPCPVPRHTGRQEREVVSHLWGRLWVPCSCREVKQLWWPTIILMLVKKDRQPRGNQGVGVCHQLVAGSYLRQCLICCCACHRQMSAGAIEDGW